MSAGTPSSGPSPEAILQAQRLFQGGDLRGAAQQLQNVLAQFPEDPKARLLFGSVLSAAGDQRSARRELLKILEKYPQHGDTNAAMAQTFRMDGNLDKALQVYDHGLAARPNHPMLLAGKADSLCTLDRAEEAFELVQPHAALAGQVPALAHAFASAARMTGRHADGVSAIQAALANPQLPAGSRMTCLFELGELLEASGDFDGALGAYREGNALFPGPFDAAQYADEVERIIQAWDKDAFAESPTASSGLDVPVFVVAAPHCGAGLIEHVLSAHPGVAAGGELASVGRIAARLSSLGDGAILAPELVTTDAVEEASNEYLTELVDVGEKVSGEGAEAPERIVDRAWVNAHHIPLVRLMFPTAAIVWCERDSLDAAVGCFTSPVSPAEAYATREGDIAAVHTGVRRLMEHWTGELGINVHRVRYEDVAGGSEDAIRSLVLAAGVEFDAACLTPEVGGDARGRGTRHSGVLRDDRVGRAGRFGSGFDSLRDALG